MVFFLAATLAAALLGFHAATYLLWYYERCRSAACASDVAAPAVAVFLSEAIALIVVVLTWPLGLIRSSRAGTSVDRPVLLVHGWCLNSASLGLLAARLRRDGRYVVFDNRSPRARNMRAAVESLAETIRELAGNSEAHRVDIVAHGVGGVIVRAAAMVAEVSPLIGNVVTIGSPHRGTALALLSRRDGLLDLRPGSSFLDDLVRGDSLPAQTHVAAIASPFDAIVFPFDLAYYPGAFNVTVEGIGHYAMLYSDRVYTLVAENLSVPAKAGAA